MKSMKEMIATKIHNKARRQMPQLPPFDKLPLQVQQQAMVMVDACLDALLEPTIGMEARGEATGEAGEGDVCKIFCAMIQAAKDGK